MAMLINSKNSRSSSNYGTRNTQASAYVVDASTMTLTGFHFSTRGGGAPRWWVGSGSPSPPPSPAGAPLSRPVLKARKRSGDAAYHITEECERLFCETLKAVFLVEGNTGFQNSLVVDMRNKNTNDNAVKIPPKQKSTIMKHHLPTPSPSPEDRNISKAGGLIKEYVEVWDYTCGARFRGFVAEKRNERTLFIFFDQEVMGQDLKPGLMALLELASSDDFECDQLVVCVDRKAGEEEVKDVARDLGWVGFQLVTLDAWGEANDCISDRWLFLGMDV